jgi:hypothetical protein
VIDYKPCAGEPARRSRGDRSAEAAHESSTPGPLSPRVFSLSRCGFPPT